MKFKSEKALQQLINNSIVATMRNYLYRVGQSVKINRTLKGFVKAVYVG